MKRLSLYQFNNYVRYLNRLAKLSESRGTLSRWAEAAGCQRSYLSNVLAGRASLNVDQGFRLSQYLGHDERESEYFRALIELDRSPSPRYREHLQVRIERLKREAEQLIKNLQRERFQPDSVNSVYYSSWHRAAIHILVSIPDYQTVTSVTTHLGISEALAQKVLNELFEMGFVERSGARYSWKSGDIHVPADSPLVVLHHQHWRQKAIEDAQLANEGSVHFTGLYSMSEEDLNDLKTRLLEFIKDYGKQASDSKAEALVCFNADFFRVGTTRT